MRALELLAITSDQVFNFLRIPACVGAIATAAVLIARLWRNAGRDHLIEILQKELAESRTRNERGEKDVQHYRDEMHDTRDECQLIRDKALLEVDLMKETLKQTEIENAGLRAKTDLSPVMTVMADFVEDNRRFIKEQTDINIKLLAALTQLLAK